MNNIKHIFFDLDHTLWDFEKNSKEALTQIFHDLKLDTKIESFDRFLKKYREINKRYWNLYRQNLVTKTQVREERFIDTFKFFKIKNYTEIGKTVSQIYIKLSPTKTNLFKGTHETLTKLKSKYKLHIITNGFVEVQHIKLTHSNLSQYFSTVVCSEETGYKKPHKSVFKQALEKAKAKTSESVMIGDSFEADVNGAIKFGMKAIWFNPLNEISKKEVQQIKSLKELSTIFNV